MRLERPDSIVALASILLVILFVLKAAITGIWLVRPWDVPDEIGHFSYIKDLATGNGIPVLHETKMDAEAWSHFTRNVQVPPDNNWIAQHPPLYHLLMVPIYWVGALFGNGFWGPFYCIRIATACLFGLGLWFAIKAFRAAGLSAMASLGLGLSLASIPNHTYLAGAVNHDAMAFLFGSLVLYYWVRYSERGSEIDLAKLGVVLGLGGLVKYTLLVLLPPVVFLVGWVMWRGRRVSVRSGVTFLTFSLFPILAWMFRNWIFMEALLPVDSSGFQSAQPLEMGWLEFGRSFPVLSIIARSYWGLLGWMGDGNLQVRWLQIYSVYQQAYAGPVLMLLGLSLFYLVKDRLNDQRGLSFVVLGGLTGVLVFTLSGWWKQEFWYYLPCFVLGSVLIGWRLVEGVCELTADNSTVGQTMETGAVLVFTFFLMVHLYKVYSYSVPSGVLQGTFGRYYLPVVGFFVLGFLRKGLRSFPFSNQLVMAMAGLYACVEIYVWLHEAIPFFHIHG